MLPRGLSRGAYLCWLGLVLLRLLVALTSTSSIHPDEHFQNPEVAAGLLFDYSTSGGELLKTWEWLGDTPCRSIASVWGSTGFAFALLKGLVGAALSARALFVAQRLGMWSLSLVLDYAVWSISRSPVSLILLASSPITFTFLLRPFSNSLETVLLAVAFLLLGRPTQRISVPLGRTRLGLIGAVLALGVWTRITFAAFAAPLVVAVALQAGQVASSEPRFRRPFAILRLGLPALASFTMTAFCLTLIDTIHFSDQRVSNVSRIVLAPLNLLKYNLATSNLAEHGLHPRYLHLVANWPMLFGVGIWAASDVLVQRLGGREDGKTREQGGGRQALYLASLVVPTAMLSIQPHQEPRFLIPLLIPLTLLIPSASFFKQGTSSARRRRRVFWTTWLIHSALFTVLFGYLHQGGLVPALLKLNEGLRAPGMPFLNAQAGGSRGSESMPQRIELVFWKIFMPPRHLLLPLQETAADHLLTLPSIHVTDLAGCSTSHLLSSLDGLAAPTTKVLLVTPAYLFDSAKVDFGARQLFGGKSFGVHVDMDRLDELVGVQWQRSGVGVWVV